MTDKMRIRFTKTDRAIYISHLDLMRTLQRSFLRAGFEMKHSEGFNPHPLMSIALPLSVCTGSECEIMDCRLKDETDLCDVPARLSAVMPEGIKVTDAYVPETKASEIKWILVEGRLEYDSGVTDETVTALRELFGRDELVIIRKTKRGEGPSDIKPGIKDFSFENMGDSVCFRALISAQEPTVNPNHLMEAIRQLKGELYPDFSEFTRKELYFENMQIFR